MSEFKEYKPTKEEQKAIENYHKAFHALRSLGWKPRPAPFGNDSEFYGIEPGSTGVHHITYCGGFYHILDHEVQDLWPSNFALWKHFDPPTPFYDPAAPERAMENWEFKTCPESLGRVLDRLLAMGIPEETAKRALALGSPLKIEEIQGCQLPYMELEGVLKQVASFSERYQREDLEGVLEGLQKCINFLKHDAGLIALCAFCDWPIGEEGGCTDGICRRMT